MVAILDKILRAGEGRVVKDLQKAAKKVNEFESAIVGLTDEQLRNKTIEFRERLAKGEDLDD